MGWSGLSKSNLMRCSGCGAALAVDVYLEKRGEMTEDLRAELLDGSALVDCIFCDDGVMSLDDSGWSHETEPEIWGFD